MGVLFQGLLFDPSSYVVSIGEVVKLLAKGCEAFVASLVESELEPKD